ELKNKQIIIKKKKIAIIHIWKEKVFEEKRKLERKMSLYLAKIQDGKVTKTSTPIVRTTTSIGTEFTDIKLSNMMVHQCDLIFNEISDDKGKIFNYGPQESVLVNSVPVPPFAYFEFSVDSVIQIGNYLFLITKDKPTQISDETSHLVERESLCFAERSSLMASAVEKSN
ncbi:hypothetical protein EIN_228250, partial [Entamoeba invadens IP1]